MPRSAPAAPCAPMRIDKLLWFLRLASTRAAAQDWTTAGHIRLNGRRVERPSAAVRAGDVLVLPMGKGVRVIEIASLPHRRGPAPEAQACYRVLEAIVCDQVLDDAAQPPLARLQTRT